MVAIPSVQRLDYRHGLVRQRADVRHKVVYNTSGTNLVASVIETNRESDSAGSPLGRFWAMHETYLYEAASREEAFFLTAVLNAKVVDDSIKGLQARGLWGERHIAQPRSHGRQLAVGGRRCLLQPTQAAKRLRQPWHVPFLPVTRWWRAPGRTGTAANIHLAAASLTPVSETRDGQAYTVVCEKGVPTPPRTSSASPYQT